MRTSQNNIRLIEKYLLGKLSPIDKLIFEARLLVDFNLRKELHFQQKTYLLIKMYHREKLKEELKDLHRRIFNDPNKINFRQNIYGIFK